MADEMKKGQKYKIPGLILAVVILAVVAICFFARPKGNPFQEYLGLGQKYLTEMNYEEAIVAFSKAIELDPRQAESYAGLAKAYAGLDDYENAIRTLEQGYEATGDEGLLLQKEQYERYLANQEIFQKLAALMEAYEESGDYNPVWDYMRQEEYQSVFDQLPEVLSYEAGHGKTLLVYPCGHCYYGSVEEGNRSGHGLWASFDYRGGWADFFDGSWEGDYPNGDGDFWLWDLHTPTIFLHHAGGFEDGKFAEKQEEDILEGVYHAIKGEEADRSMHQREFSREVMEEVQAKLDNVPQPVPLPGDGEGRKTRPGMT